MENIAGLRWHTTLDDARRERRPILSLRLLGRLDREPSCANSRLFRTTLYPAEIVSRVLHERFALHWESVRPVPRVTIDFGDGRAFEQTITGNSVHLVLDGRGRPVDAIPGLHDAAGFARLAGAAADLAIDVTPLDGSARRARLARWHGARRRSIVRAWIRDLAAVGVRAPSEDPAALERLTDWSRLAELGVGEALPDPRVRDRILGELRAARDPFDARAAGAIAPTKMAVERPILDALLPLARTIAEDAVRNELELHRRVHEAFVDGGVTGDVDALCRWIYRELFRMPLDDPWLGLRSAAFAAPLQPSRRA